MSSKKFIALFFLLNLLIASVFLDDRKNPNATSRVLQVAALSEVGHFYIDGREDKTLDKAYVDGHYYPLQPPFPTMLTLPVYQMLKGMGICHPYELDDGSSIFKLGAFITSSLPLAILMTWFLLYLISLGKSTEDAILLSSLPFYGSLFFIYTGVFYSHILVALGIFGAFSLLKQKKNFVVAGLLSGTAFFSEYLTAIIFAIWFLQLLFIREWRAAFLYALGALPFIIMFLIYNYITTGNALLTVYSFNVAYEMTNVGFSRPNLSSIYGLLFSRWRGAFIYMPILATTLLHLSWKWKGWKHLLSEHALLPSLMFLVLLSSYEEWHGGWTFGPRYLMPAMMLFYTGFSSQIDLSSTKKWLYWIPISLGLLISFSAKITTGFNIPSSYRYPIYDYIIPKVLARDWIDTGFTRNPEGSILTLCLLFVLFAVVIFKHRAFVR